MRPKPLAKRFRRGPAARRSDAPFVVLPVLPHIASRSRSCLSQTRGRCCSAPAPPRVRGAHVLVATELIFLRLISASYLRGYPIARAPTIPDGPPGQAAARVWALLEPPALKRGHTRLRSPGSHSAELGRLEPPAASGRQRRCPAQHRVCGEAPGGRPSICPTARARRHPEALGASGPTTAGHPRHRPCARAGGLHAGPGERGHEALRPLAYPRIQATGSGSSVRKVEPTETPPAADTSLKMESRRRRLTPWPPPQPRALRPRDRADLRAPPHHHAPDRLDRPPRPPGIDQRGSPGPRAHQQPHPGRCCPPRSRLAARHTARQSRAPAPSRASHPPARPLGEGQGGGAGRTDTRSRAGSPRAPSPRRAPARAPRGGSSFRGSSSGWSRAIAAAGASSAAWSVASIRTPAFASGQSEALELAVELHVSRADRPAPDRRGAAPTRVASRRRSPPARRARTARRGRPPRRERPPRAAHDPAATIATSVNRPPRSPRSTCRSDQSTGALSSV